MKNFAKNLKIAKNKNWFHFNIVKKKKKIAAKREKSH